MGLIYGRESARARLQGIGRELGVLSGLDTELGWLSGLGGELDGLSGEPQRQAQFFLFFNPFPDVGIVRRPPYAMCVFIVCSNQGSTITRKITQWLT